MGKAKTYPIRSSIKALQDAVVALRLRLPEAAAGRLLSRDCLRSKRHLHSPVLDFRRFFFTPSSTRSIIEENSDTDGPTESLAVDIVSHNAYGDFRRSMEELMAAARGRVGWEEMLHMLRWYLRLNDDRVHEVIVRSFIDMVSCASTCGGSASSAEFSSSSSSSSSSCNSCCHL